VSPSTARSTTRRYGATARDGSSAARSTTDGGSREPGEGANRLAEWLDENDREPGDVIVLDVVVPGELYGLRIPGERTVYEANRGPRSSLSDIARDLDG